MWPMQARRYEGLGKFFVLLPIFAPLFLMIHADQIVEGEAFMHSKETQDDKEVFQPLQNVFV